MTIRVRLLGVVSLVLVAAAITNLTLRGQDARPPIATQEDFQRADEGPLQLGPVGRTRRAGRGQPDHDRQAEAGAGAGARRSHGVAGRTLNEIDTQKRGDVTVANEEGLRRALAAYVAYYMRSRTHLALGKDSPVARPVQSPSAGPIVATPVVGGLHHRYDRLAA